MNTIMNALPKKNIYKFNRSQIECTKYHSAINQNKSAVEFKRAFKGVTSWKWRGVTVDGRGVEIQ